MKSRWHVFNLFLVLTPALFLTACATSEERKHKHEYSNIRVHIEADTSGDRAAQISVLRSAPIHLSVVGDPILDERSVEEAQLVTNDDGTYAIKVKFNRRGSWALERYTVTHRGKHLAIFSYFGQGRWLAAPMITAKNSSSYLVFTPDASREESERIVRGLQNTVHKLMREENWPFATPFESDMR